ncbi:MAG: EpsI family protein [Candidatus Omnitrophota bacterium]|nr:EpsI family protein [Candidatus Omnitrophota bacterium]
MPNNKTCLITIALLGLTLLGLAYVGRRQSIPAAEINLKDIPLTLGEWKGKDVPISERSLEILETKDVLIREYTNARGKKASLVIVYSSVNRGAFHPPEICFLGGGTELLDKGITKIEIAEGGENLPVIEVNRLLMKDRAGKKIAWYWFTAGNRVVSSYYRQQGYFIWDELSRGRGCGSLIRVSTRATRGDIEEADSSGRDFISQITPVILNYLFSEKK